MININIFKGYKIASDVLCRKEERWAQDQEFGIGLATSCWVNNSREGQHALPRPMLLIAKPAKTSSSWI